MKYVLALRLREALTFHASFDHGPDADFGKGDRRLFSAPSLNHPRTGTPGLPTNGVVSLARGEGKFGDALRFHRKAPELIFFQAEKNLSYAKSNWSGTVSFWLRLDPNTDLEEGYCDPLQITPREWNDAALWVDFSKDERPRHFRLGTFADRAVWDPTNRNYDALPASERPVVTVTKPPFTRDRWAPCCLHLRKLQHGKEKRHGDALPRWQAPRHDKRVETNSLLGTCPGDRDARNQLHRAIRRAGLLQSCAYRRRSPPALHATPWRGDAVPVSVLPNVHQDTTRAKVNKGN